MGNIRTPAILVALLTTVPALCLAEPGTSQSKATRSSTAAMVHATKGVVKSVDTNKLVITRSPSTDGR